MQLHVLGSGSILSRGGRNPSGYIVKTETGQLLVDCGPGILRRIDEEGFDVMDFDGIILSHFHLDHCTDVLPLLMKRHLTTPGVNSDFFIAGSYGLRHWFDQMAGMQGDWLNAHLPELIDLSEHFIRWKGFDITCTYNGHTEDSIAIRFDGDRCLFYSSDTDFSSDLASFAAGAHLGIVECSQAENNKVRGHMVPSETGRFAALAGFGHLVVTHLYPENENPSLETQIARYFHGTITIAWDGFSTRV